MVSTGHLASAAFGVSPPSRAAPLATRRNAMRKLNSPSPILGSNRKDHHTISPYGGRMAFPPPRVTAGEAPSEAAKEDDGVPVPTREFRDGSRIFAFGDAREAPPADAPAAGSKGMLHFIGIGGAGLSALASLAIADGYSVRGSDANDNPKLKKLTDRGAVVYVGHAADQLSSITDAVIVSSAVPADNPELVAAREQGVQVYKRDEWLAKITDAYDLVACAGTHGKTSTSAMMAVVLDQAGVGGGVSAVVGGDVAQFPGGGGTLEHPDGTCFVLEADEYDGAFLGLRPAVAVVTNVEWDHVDIYASEQAVRDTFRRFVRRVRPGGLLLLCGDDAGARSLSDSLDESDLEVGECGEGEDGVEEGWAARSVMTYGIAEGSDWRAESVTSNEVGGSDYVLTLHGDPVAKVSLPLPGAHMINNSLAVVATAAVLGAAGGRRLPEGGLAPVCGAPAAELSGAAAQAAFALQGFQGVARRFQKVGEAAGGRVQVFDDYAHHPTEVRAALDGALQRFPGSKVWVVFQPHTYSRLHQFMAEFGPCFARAARVLVTDVFAAREKNKYGVGAEQLVAIVTGTKCPAEYVPELDGVVEGLVEDLKGLGEGERVVVVTMGAGTVTQVGPRLLEGLGEEE